MSENKIMYSRGKAENRITGTKYWFYFATIYNTKRKESYGIQTFYHAIYKDGKVEHAPLWNEKKVKK